MIDDDLDDDVDDLMPLLPVEDAHLYSPLSIDDPRAAELMPRPWPVARGLYLPLEPTPESSRSPAPRPRPPRPFAKPDRPLPAPARARKGGPAPAAQRMRRYRERARRGGMCVTVEITEDLVEALGIVGFLDPVLADSRRHVAAAIARVLATLASEG